MSPEFSFKRVLIVVAMLAAVGLADAGGAIRSFNDWLAANRMAIGERQPGGEIVLVEIDATSIAALRSWPWPRRKYAELIDRLLALGATEIALDIDFSSPSTPVDDAILARALERAGGAVVLAAFSQREASTPDGKIISNLPIEDFARHAWSASVNVHPDGDGIVRHYPYGAEIAGETLPSMPVVLSGAVASGSQEFPIDFSIDSDAIDQVSVIDVLEDRVARDRIAGRKVFVGAQALELGDFFSVPRGRIISGVMLQALATETLLQGRVLVQPGQAMTVAGLLLIAALSVSFARLDWRLRMLTPVLVAIGVEASATALQYFLPISLQTGALHLASLTAVLASLLVEIDIRHFTNLMVLGRARNAESTLKRVIEDSFNGVVVVDEKGLVRAASRAASDILGLHDSLTGHTAKACLPDSLFRELEMVLNSDTDRAGEVLFTPPGRKTRVLDFVVTPSRQDDVDANGRRIACLTFSDVTEERTAAARIERMAKFDTLTGLANRNQFIERLEAAAVAGASGRTLSCAVICFDLDNFKKVNDTLGHSVGDGLLVKVAERTASLLPPGGLVARLGGDEFAVVIVDEIAGVLVRDCAERIIATLSEPFDIGGHRVAMTSSVGVTVVDASAAQADVVIREADIALYRAKEKGGNCWVDFNPDMLEPIARRQQIELDLGRAMADDQFEVWYQPQVNPLTRKIRGFEALLRWRHPERGLVSPGEFIPVAESIGLIERLGRWVLETACRDAAGWPEHISVSINVSADQFARSDMTEVVRRALTQSGLSPARLELEITESLFVQSAQSVKQVLLSLRKRGVRIALDDFGTGYSSLSYLHTFPIDKIKIDRSFVSRIEGQDGNGMAILRAIAALSAHLGITLNAEGIETEAQEKALAGIGTDETQGFLYARPQPLKDIQRFISTGFAHPEGTETGSDPKVTRLYG